MLLSGMFGFTVVRYNIRVNQKAEIAVLGIAYTCSVLHVGNIWTVYLADLQTSMSIGHRPRHKLKVRIREHEVTWKRGAISFLIC